MSEEVHQVPPMDQGVRECWQRWPDDGREADARGVVVAADEEGGWNVEIAAGEFFRGGGPLGRDLKQRMENALVAVPGVTGLYYQSHDECLVYGAASGQALCQAATNVLDEMADACA